MDQPTVAAALRVKFAPVRRSTTGPMTPTPFADFAALCRAAGGARPAGSRSDASWRSSSRARRRTRWRPAVAFLTARPFPTSDPRVLSVRGLPRAAPDARRRPAARRSATSATRSPAVAAATRRRLARAAREARARPRSRRAPPRTSASSSGGSSAARCAPACRTGSCWRRSPRASGADLAAVAPGRAVPRRSLRRGGAGARGGAAALAGVAPRPFVPLLPMLAEIADDFGRGAAPPTAARTALEYKYDGARIQLHRDGDRVAIWTRRLSDVTRSLPDVVDIARRDLARRAVHPRRRGGRARRRRAARCRSRS